MPEGMTQVGDLGKICVELAQSKNLVLNPTEIKLLDKRLYDGSEIIRRRATFIDYSASSPLLNPVALRGVKGVLTLEYIRLQSNKPEEIDQEALLAETHERIVWIRKGPDSDDNVILAKDKITYEASSILMGSRHIFRDLHKAPIGPFEFAFSPHDKDVFPVITSFLKNIFY